MRIALLSYSTKPRGGVVHTLSLAEALAAQGADVTVWSLGRGGDTTFYRAVDPRVRLSVVPFPDQPGEGVGDRILRSISVLRNAFDPTAYDIIHAQDCISANAVGRITSCVSRMIVIVSAKYCGSSLAAAPRANDSASGPCPDMQLCKLAQPGSNPSPLPM